MVRVDHCAITRQVWTVPLLVSAHSKRHTVHKNTVSDIYFKSVTTEVLGYAGAYLETGVTLCSGLHAYKCHATKEAFGLRQSSLLHEDLSVDALGFKANLFKVGGRLGDKLLHIL